jgi:hypothetical protein
MALSPPKSAEAGARFFSDFSTSPAARLGLFAYSRSVLLTKASFVPSGDHDGTFMVPWPP